VTVPFAHSFPELNCPALLSRPSFAAFRLVPFLLLAIQDVNALALSEGWPGRALDFCSRQRGLAAQCQVEAKLLHTALRPPSPAGSMVSGNNARCTMFDYAAIIESSLNRSAYCRRAGRSGLSVEQRKRLTIAVELVANPSIVFMDEPTSGAYLQ